MTTILKQLAALERWAALNEPSAAMQTIVDIERRYRSVWDTLRIGGAVAQRIAENDAAMDRMVARLTVYDRPLALINEVTRATQGLDALLRRNDQVMAELERYAVGVARAAQIETASALAERVAAIDESVQAAQTLARLLEHAKVTPWSAPASRRRRDRASRERGAARLALLPSEQAIDRWESLTPETVAAIDVEFIALTLQHEETDPTVVLLVAIAAVARQLLEGPAVQRLLEIALIISQLLFDYSLATAGAQESADQLEAIDRASGRIEQGVRTANVRLSRYQFRLRERASDNARPLVTIAEGVALNVHRHRGAWALVSTTEGSPVVGWVREKALVH
ncbi:MAG: hypothetical protein JWO05_1131 [Gemmatimonadetes bacterium]|nr:hypothetical protein [Gemmatimonadota bacterium]